MCCWRPSASSTIEALSGQEQSPAVVVTYVPPVVLQRPALCAESLLGALPRVRDVGLVTESGDRSRLFAQSTGSVQVQLSVIVRGFDAKGVMLHSSPQ